MNDMYSLHVHELSKLSGKQITVVEQDADLFYEMAFSLYSEIEANLAENKKTVCIMPVGPVFQYRRFIRLLKWKPLDLSGLHIFFMDEYLDDQKKSLNRKNPLSFAGFIERELVNPMPGEFNLMTNQLHFPSPENPESFDKKIERLGGIDLCHAGVGIVGHLAFNEPVNDDEPDDIKMFSTLPTRVTPLTRETITINSHTAMNGALERIPAYAVTVGMKQILSSRKLRIYFNRPWQKTVFRKALCWEPTARFPVTLARNHPDVAYIVTQLVAQLPEFALK